MKKSLTLAMIITLVLVGIMHIGSLYGGYNPGTGTQYSPKHLGKGSRDFEEFLHEIGTTGTYRDYYSDTKVTGSSSTGRIGTTTGLPCVEYNENGGTPYLDIIGMVLKNNGADVGLADSMSAYLLSSGGAGTTNTFTDTTLAGNAIVTANISANGANISPVEISHLDNTDSNIKTHFTTVENDILAHAHTGMGTDSVKIDHDDLTNKGTNTHATIDNFIASKAQASGLASLDSNALVVENPANGTITSMANGIPIADGSGKIADGWLNSTITALGQSIELGTETIGNTDSIFEGDINKYYTDARVNAAVGSLSVSDLSDVDLSGGLENYKLVLDAGLNVIAATDTVVMDWSGIEGNPLDNGSISVTGAAGKIPVGSTTVTLDYSWIPADTRLYTSNGEFGRWYGTTTTIGGYGTETLLLLHMNPGTTTFVDSSSYNKVITANGTVTGTGTAKFGSGSGMFGNSAYLTFPTDSTTALSGDFTIEGWAYPLTAPSNACLWGGDSDTTNMRGVQIMPINASQIDILVANNDGNAWQINPGTEVNTPTITNNVWTHWAITRQNTSIRFYWGGTLIRTGTTTSNPKNDGTLYVGARNDVSIGNFFNGNIDEVHFNNTTALYTTYSFTPPNAPYDAHTQYSTIYTSPNDSVERIKIQTPGTTTTEPSYIMLNGSTTIIGAGTTTSVTGTSTTYAVWADGAIRATAFNVASSAKIKENIVEIKIKPSNLKAEGIAKTKYISDKKQDWLDVNYDNYVYVINETGTGTVTYVDTETLENDYATYVELEWASDLNQNFHVDAVIKMTEKGFWETFDSMKPKSWNPKGRTEDRKGFVVEEMPDEVKGDDKASIDPMKLIAYITIVLQSLKEDNVFTLKALREFITTGTSTMLSGIGERIEVLGNK